MLLTAATAPVTLTGCSPANDAPAETETVYVTASSAASPDDSPAVSGEPEKPTASPSVVTVTETAAETSTMVITTEEQLTPPTPAANGDPDAIPPYPGAGGPAPDHARQPNNFNGTIDDPSVKYAAVRNNSGSVYCGMLPDEAYEKLNCMLPGLQASGKYGHITEPYEENLHQVTFQPDGTAELWPTSGGPLSTANITAQDAEPLDDGDAVVFGGTVCTGHDGGLTCWVIGSGHGVDLADNYVRMF
ncbi:hypothetical protein ACFSSC_06450 [Corynebacterium mendelii]